MAIVPLNAYTTVAEMLTLIRSNSTDAPDDDEIARLIEECSGAVNDATNRQFYPSVEVNYYNTPVDSQAILELDEDFVEVTSIVNGDGSVLSSTDYKLYPLNAYPKRQVVLNPTTGKAWVTASGNPDGAISVTGIQAFHDRYNLAWRNRATLTAPIDNAVLTAAVSSTSGLYAGNTVKIGTEFMRVGAASGTTLTFDERGINGSTAAAHSTNDVVYQWQVHNTVIRCAKLLVKHFYDQRFGEGVGGAATITGAGIVITPSGFPVAVQEMLMNAGLFAPGIG